MSRSPSGPDAARGALPDVLGYALVREVHRGALASVFEGLHRASGARAAVKVLHGDASVLHADERFAREVQAAKAFSHSAHVPVVGEGFTTAGRPFVAYAWVAGTTLAEHLAAHGPFDGPAAARHAHTLLGYLAALHAAGIAHRDLHPGNVLVGDDGELRVIDLGIAALGAAAAAASERAGLTPPHRVMGTPPYCAPERMVGDDRHSPAGDLYAAAVVIYELFTGARPWPGVAVEGDAAPMAAFVQPAPAAVEAVLRRALAHHVGERFATADAFRQAFGNAARADGLVR